MPERRDIEYGRYRIVAQGGRAVAYLGKVKVADASGKGDHEAVENAKAEIAKLRAERRSKRINDVPTTEEYEEALATLAHEISPSQRLMLQAHYRQRKMSVEELAKAAGYSDYSAANLQYGLLGRKVGEFVEYPPQPGLSGELAWTFVLARRGDETTPGRWIWELHDELAEAMRRLNIR